MTKAKRVAVALYVRGSTDGQTTVNHSVSLRDSGRGRQAERLPGGG